MAGKYIRKASDEHFIKTFNLINFRVFNPKYKQCLSGTERGLFDYILIKRLTYTGKTRPYGGNTIKIDKQFKEKLLKEFNVSAKTYEGMITKLVQDSILNRLANGYYQVNPYAFCKGENTNLLRELDIYRDSTLIFKDEKCICQTVPAENPWAKNEGEDTKRNAASSDAVDDVPVMPPIKGRKATLNNCFKK